MRIAAGMVLFDKPQGWTSHDAAEAFRRMLPPKTKVGHCGTLDPLATGLLILLVGPCTRLQARMQGLDKVYSGVVRLGLETDTGDITGKVLEEKPVPPLTLGDLQEVLERHHGTLEMDAPAFSAVKHQGRALYKYARRGIPVPSKPRTCRVHRWEALSYAAPDLEHRLLCSSGTYVRSLAQAIGRELGCGGTVLSLRRESIGRFLTASGGGIPSRDGSVTSFSVDEALTLEQAKTLSQPALQALLAGSLRRLDEFVFSLR